MRTDRGRRLGLSDPAGTANQIQNEIGTDDHSEYRERSWYSEGWRDDKERQQRERCKWTVGQEPFCNVIGEPGALGHCLWARRMHNSPR